MKDPSRWALLVIVVHLGAMGAHAPGDDSPVRSGLRTPFAASGGLAARGKSPAAFGRRCIPPGCVAPRSNTPGILTRRALPSGRIAALGATPDFHHGLLNSALGARARLYSGLAATWVILAALNV